MDVLLCIMRCIHCSSWGVDEYRWPLVWQKVNGFRHLANFVGIRGKVEGTGPDQELNRTLEKLGEWLWRVPCITCCNLLRLPKSKPPFFLQSILMRAEMKENNHKRKVGSLLCPWFLQNRPNPSQQWGVLHTVTVSEPIKVYRVLSGNFATQNERWHSQ